MNSPTSSVCYMGNKEVEAYFAEFSLNESKMETDSTPPQPASSISRRLVLPPEVLDLIWRAALDLMPSRVIEISYPILQMPSIPTRSLVPPLLHTCRQSRQLFLLRYKLSFNNSQSYKLRKVFFDPEKDVLLVGRLDPQAHQIASNLSTFTSADDRSSLHTIAIHISLDFLGEDMRASVWGMTFLEVTYLDKWLMLNFRQHLKVVFVVEHLEMFTALWEWDGTRNIWISNPDIKVNEVRAFCNLMRNLAVRWQVLRAGPSREACFVDRQDFTVGHGKWEKHQLPEVLW